MSLSWTPIEGSSLVAAAAFDRAAQRIYVRRRSGAIHTYENCDDNRWREFMSPSMSKGEYLTRVLTRYEDRRLMDGSRATLTDSTMRGIALNAFRPAQEMTDPRLFAGRQTEVREIADALRIAGSWRFRP